MGQRGPAVRVATAADVPAVVGLHVSRIGEGFLVTLGPRFLRRLYRRIVRSPNSFVLVADDGAGVEGFVAVAESTSRLYREFLVRDAVPAALGAVPAVARAPRRVWETLRWGFGTDDDQDLPAAEILSIAVAEGSGGRGIGSGLAAAALAELERRGVREARVVTAVGNEPAVRMYERVGFERVRRVEVHRGTPQEMMVWR